MSVDNDVDIQISVDDSRVHPAVGRINGAMDRMERASQQAARNITGPFEKILNILTRIGDVAGGIYALHQAFERVGQGIDATTHRMEGLLVTYRASEAILTRSMAPLMRLGTVLATEELVKFVYHQGKAAEASALAAAQVGLSVQAYEKLAFVSQRSGISQDALNSYAAANGGADAVLSQIERLRQIEDPVRRAQATFNAFGRDAATVLQGLSVATADAAASYDAYVQDIDRDSLDRFVQRIRDVSDGWNMFKSVVGAIKLDFKNALVDMTTYLGDFLALVAIGPYGNQQRRGVLQRSLEDRSLAYVSSLGGYDKVNPADAAFMRTGLVASGAIRTRDEWHFEPGRVTGVPGAGGVGSWVKSTVPDYSPAPLMRDRAAASWAVYQGQQERSGTLLGLREKLAAEQAGVGKLERAALAAPNDIERQAIEQSLAAGDRRVDSVNKQIEVLEKQMAKEKEFQALREKGLEYWKRVRGLMGPQWGRSGIDFLIPDFARAANGLGGTSLEVKPEDIPSMRPNSVTEAYQWKLGTDRRAYTDETLAMKNATADRRLAGDTQIVQRDRDLQLAAVDRIGAYTLQQKISVEGQRLQIEERAINSEAGLQVEAIDRRKQRETEYLEWLMRKFPERQAELQSRIDSVIESHGQESAELETKWQGDIEKSRASTATRQAQLVNDAWQQQFQNLKSGFEGLFDAALAGGKGFADSLRRMFLSIFLTPIKESMANWAANIFTPMMGPAGARGGMGQMGGGGGMLGGLGSIFMGGGGGSFGGGTGGGMFPGATPPFWGGGGGGSFGGGLGGGMYPASNAGGIRIFGGAPPSGVDLTTGVSTGAGWLSKIGGGFGGKYGGAYNGLATMGGMMLLADGWNKGNGVRGTIERTAGAGAMAYGIAGKQLGLVGSAGVGLAADGFSRIGRGNGWGQNLAGIGEMTGGGALVGMKIGAMFGPIGAGLGAAIGAAAGATIGVLKLLLSTDAAGAVVKKVQERYGITIDKAFAKALLDQGKAFGSLDLFIGSPQGRELIYLYAEMTNQRSKATAIDSIARGVNLQQQGGSLYQAASYVNGQAYGYSSSLASLGNLTTFAPNPATSAAPIYLDPGATKDYWNDVMATGIVNNPRAVQASSNVSTSQSSGRVAAAINLMDPLAVAL